MTKTEEMETTISEQQSQILALQAQLEKLKQISVMEKK